MSKAFLDELKSFLDGEPNGKVAMLTHMDLAPEDDRELIRWLSIRRLLVIDKYTLREIIKALESTL